MVYDDNLTASASISSFQIYKPVRLFGAEHFLTELKGTIHSASNGSNTKKSYRKRTQRASRVHRSTFDGDSLPIDDSIVARV